MGEYPPLTHAATHRGPAPVALVPGPHAGRRPVQGVGAVSPHELS